MPESSEAAKEIRSFQKSLGDRGLNTILGAYGSKFENTATMYKELLQMFDPINTTFGDQLNVL